MHQKTTQRQHRFGRIKPDGVPALRLAAPIGVAAAAGIGAALWFEFPQMHGGTNAWIGIAVAGACFAPVMVALAWVLLVDRSTIPGAIAHPEHSMENSWYDQAAKDSFHLLLVGTGFGAAIAGFCLPPMVSWTLAAAAFGTSYLIRKAGGR